MNEYGHLVCEKMRDLAEIKLLVKMHHLTKKTEKGLIEIYT